MAKRTPCKSLDAERGLLPGQVHSEGIGEVGAGQPVGNRALLRGRDLPDDCPHGGSFFPGGHAAGHEAVSANEERGVAPLTSRPYCRGERCMTRLNIALNDFSDS